MTRCEQLGVCQVTGCSRCLDKLLMLTKLNPDKTCANISATGLDHQTLDAVDTTKSDKRDELSMNLLDHFGVATTGANAKVCNLDKRECPHFSVFTRVGKVIHSFSLVVFLLPLKFKKIKFRFPHLRQQVQQVNQKGVL